MRNKLGVYSPTAPFVSYFLALLLLANGTLAGMAFGNSNIEYIRIHKIGTKLISYESDGTPMSTIKSSNPSLDPSMKFLYPYDFVLNNGDTIVLEMKFNDTHTKSDGSVFNIIGGYYNKRQDLSRVTLELELDSKKNLFPVARPSDSNGNTNRNDLISYIVTPGNAKNPLYYSFTVSSANHDNRLSLEVKPQIGNSHYTGQNSPLLIEDDADNTPLRIKLSDNTNLAANVTYDAKSSDQPPLVPEGIPGVRVDLEKPKINTDQDTKTLSGTPSGKADSHVYAVWVDSSSDSPLGNYMAEREVEAGTPASQNATFYGAGAVIQGTLQFTEAMRLHDLDSEMTLKIPDNQRWIVLGGMKTSGATVALNQPEEGMTDPPNTLRILTFTAPNPIPDSDISSILELNPTFLAGRVSEGAMDWSGITDRAGNNLDISPPTMTMLAPIPGESDLAPLSISGIDGHVVDNVEATTTILEEDLPTNPPKVKFPVTIRFQNVFGDDPSDKFAEFHKSTETNFLDALKNGFEIKNGKVTDSVVYKGVQMSPANVKRDDKFFPYYTLYTVTILPQGPLVTINLPEGTVSDIAGNMNKALVLVSADGTEKDKVTVTAAFTREELDDPPSISRVKFPDPFASYTAESNIDVEVTFDINAIENPRYHGTKPYVPLHLGSQQRNAEWSHEEASDTTEGGNPEAPVMTTTKVTFRYTVKSGDDTSKVILGESVTLPEGSIIYSFEERGIADSSYYKATTQTDIPFFPDDSRSKLEVPPEISRVVLKPPDSQGNIDVEVTFNFQNALFIGQVLPYVTLYLGSKDDTNMQTATWESAEDATDTTKTKVTFHYERRQGEDTSKVILGDLTLPEDSIIYSATEDAGSYYIDPAEVSYYKATEEEKISFFAGASDLPEISRVVLNPPDPQGNIDVEVTLHNIENARFIGPIPYVTLYLGRRHPDNMQKATWHSEEDVESTKVTFRYEVPAGTGTSKVILGNSVTLPKDSIIYSATDEGAIDPAADGYYEATSQTDIPFFSGETFDSPPRISRPAFPEDAPDSYNEGDHIEVEVTFDIDNAQDHGEAPYVTLYLGSRDEENRREATWVPNSEVDVESTKVTFRYTVQSGDDTSKVFLGNSVTLREGSIIYSAVGSSNAEYRYYIATGGPIELRRPSGQRDANASAVAMDRVIFNELRNAREDKNDWLELKNISDEAISLKAWQISLVTGQSDEAVVAFPDYTLPPGGILLIVNTDPGATDLARGENIASAASKGGGVATQYFVAPSLKLPDTPYLLLLRSASDKTGKPEAVEDVLGTYFRASLEYATQVWPLRETTQPENAAVLTPDEAWQRKFEEDQGTARGYAAAAWRASGYQAGLGYDAKASERSSLGTPGYPNEALVRQSGTGQISVSEVMFSAEGGPHSLPQWIELYNNSSTDAVNLAGWKLEVALRTAEGVLRAGRFTFETLHVLPNQTVLLVTYNGRNSGHFPDARVYNLATRHGAELPLNTQRNALLSADGFSLQLSDTDGTLIDAIGNLGSDSAPAWNLPSGKTADGHRISLRRQYEKGTRTPRDGMMRASWVSGVRAAAALRTYWGHPQDVGTPGYRSGGPLPVALSAFLPRRTADAVVIKWATQSELDNAGFNLLRSESKTGTFKVINPTLIRGAGTSGERHLYQYTDKTAKPGVVYYYQLEEVSFAGVRETLRTARLRGEVSAGDKLTVIWGNLKKLD